MSAKIISIEEFLKRKYNSKKKYDEEERLDFCDKCRKMKRWREENESDKRKRTKGSDICLDG